MRYYSKHVGIAQITDPAAVLALCASSGIVGTESGAIWCTIPELGFENTNMIYCRYGLSIPYIRVQQNAKVWVEPTIGDRERWIYTGFADCGGDVTPDTSTQLLIQLLSQVIYATTTGTMHLSSKTASEAFVKGTTFSTELMKHYTLITTLKSVLNAWNPSIDPDCVTLKTALAGFLALELPDYSQILSTVLFGE